MLTMDSGARIIKFIESAKKNIQNKTNNVYMTRKCTATADRKISEKNKQISNDFQNRIIQRNTDDDKTNDEV